jgi:hypothetical protein
MRTYLRERKGDPKHPAGFSESGICSRLSWRAQNRKTSPRQSMITVRRGPELRFMMKKSKNYRAQKEFDSALAEEY